jgi:chorismate dehydratase
MGELRIGSVPYLNAKPLIEGLDGVVLDVPSRLTATFRRGELDVALLPSYEAARNSELAIVPGICVGSPGPVDSVLIFSRVPVEECRTVALDTSSLTSTALARILFSERWGTEPVFTGCPPDVDPRRAGSDAVLLIGDPAMRAPRDGLTVTDVASAWREWTGLPFPFALWTAPDAETARRAAPILAAAKERGLARRGEMAAAAAAEVALPREFLYRYLTSRITYDLGEGELESLERYARYVEQLDL